MTMTNKCLHLPAHPTVQTLVELMQPHNYDFETMLTVLQANTTTQIIQNSGITTKPQENTLPQLMVNILKLLV